MYISALYIWVMVVVVAVIGGAEPHCENLAFFDI